MGMKLFKLFKEILPIATTLLSAYLVYKLPITIFSFIPDDKVYSTSISIYSILILIVFKAIEWLVYFLDSKKAKIELEFSLVESKYGQNKKEVDCYFSSDTAKVFVNLYIKSSVKKAKKAIIRIILPPKVDVQPIERYSSLYTIDKQKRIIEIKVENLINSSMKQINGESTEMGFQIIKNTAVINSGPEIVLVEKMKSTQFIFNKLIFKE